MAISERDVHQAETRMATLRGEGHAVSARYDRRRARIVVALDTGLEMTFPARMAQGLSGADADDLADIEISGAGLGLYWPRLDADLYIPALMQGIFGSKAWMARELGASGGRSRTPAKIAASRRNGQTGGRPKKTVTA